MALPGSLIRMLPGGCSQGVGWACSLTARVEEGERSAGSSCGVGRRSVQHVGLSAPGSRWILVKGHPQFLAVWLPASGSS